MKIHGRNDITIGIWNTRTLRVPGKVREQTHEMDRYRWNILGLREMRRKNFGETTTEEGQRISSVEENTSIALDFLFTRTS